VIYKGDYSSISLNKFEDNGLALSFLILDLNSYILFIGNSGMLYLISNSKLIVGEGDLYLYLSFIKFFIFSVSFISLL
jgi:hypothetical protein